MNKLMAIIAILMLMLSSGFSDAQENTPAPSPVVHLGMTGQNFANGKTLAGPTATKEEILANSHLILDGSTCQIAGFRFRMLPDNGGAKDMAPITVTGAELTPQIKKMIQDLNKPAAKIFIDEITVRCASGESRATPIVLTMEPNTK